MNPLAYIPLVCFTTCVFMGAYIFFRNPKAAVNGLYFVLVILCGFLTLIEFGYWRAQTRAEAQFWWSLDFFWPLSILALVFFVFVYTDNTHLFKRPWAYALSVGPALFFFTVDLLTGWITVPPIAVERGFIRGTYRPDTFLGIATCLWLLAMWIWVLFLIWQHFWRSRGSRKRAQAVALGVACLTAFSGTWLIDLLRNTVLENFGIGPPMSTGITASLAILGYSVWKFEMFALTPVTAAETIVATMSDALLLINPRLKVDWINCALLGLSGRSKSDLIGEDINGLFDRPVLPIASAESSRTDNASPYLEAQLKSANGLVATSLARSELRNSKGRLLGYLIIARNITDVNRRRDELFQHRHRVQELIDQRTRDLDLTQIELRNAAVQLRALGDRIVAAKESESARISRELHDELGQILTGIKIDVALALRKLARDSNSSQLPEMVRVKRMLEHCDQAIKSVQSMVKELRPTMLDDIGLVETVRWMAEEFERQTGLECEVTADATSQKLDSGLATAAYRIVQEALHNIHRHSGANAVALNIEQNEDSLVIDIEDDGVGVAPAQIENSETVGIVSMSARAEAYGGRLLVESSALGGTAVRLSVPIEGGLRV